MISVRTKYMLNESVFESDNKFYNYKNEERKLWERSKKDTVTLKIRIGQNKLCFLNIDRFVFVVTLIHPQKIDRNR